MFKHSGAPLNCSISQDKSFARYVINKCLRTGLRNTSGYDEDADCDDDDDGDDDDDEDDYDDDDMHHSSSSSSLRI